MNHQSGLSLFELLISLFLASIIMTTLMQLYLSNKKQYIEMQKLLETNLDLQWINDLLANSIRRAGFTPCLGIDQLEAIDSRNLTRRISGLNVASVPQKDIQINRMSEIFTEIIKIINPRTLLVSNGKLLKKQGLVLIANCEQAEIQQLAKINKIAEGYLVTLTKPLLHSYTTPLYIGDWLEEKWFIKPNANKRNSLHYQVFQTEELSSLIHSMHIKVSSVHEKKLVKVIMGLDHKNTWPLVVAVRGS